jgi:lycopene cyclase domain-containing protein
MSYTALAIIGVVASAGLDLVVLRTNLLRRRVFWISYLIVLFFQLIVNGVLTGRRVVSYNPADVVGGDSPQFIGDGRFIYAPVEDLFFGFALVVQTLAWWVWWGRRLPER